MLRKKIYPNEIRQITILILIYLLGISIFGYFTYYKYRTGNMSGYYMWLVGTIIVLIGLPLYGLYYWKASRPYVISEKWIEIPKAYVPKEGNKKVLYKDINELGYVENTKYGRKFCIKTDEGDYVIRDDVKDKIVREFNKRNVW